MFIVGCGDVVVGDATFVVVGNIVVDASDGTTVVEIVTPNVVKAVVDPAAVVVPVIKLIEIDLSSL